MSYDCAKSARAYASQPLFAAGCGDGLQAALGKPLETMGRKARGCRAGSPALCSFGCMVLISKPSETVGRKARG